MLVKLLKYKNHIISFIVLMIIGFFYNRYQEKLEREENKNNYKAIQDYLLRDPDSLSKESKPILWIPISYEYNARDWLSFGSRSSLDLNQPYLYLTVNSIISHCDKSFRICILDDNSFDMLLPTWSIDMSKISKPISSYMRSLGLAKLLYKYGGMIVPPGFLCMKDLIELYNTNTINDKMFVCENIDRNSSSVKYMYYPNINMMGSDKECEILNKFISFMEITISEDYTSETEFLGKFAKWCDYGIKEKKINLIDGKMIGIKTKDDKPVLLDNLLSNDYINFSDNMYGIYIPSNEILNRIHYQWFARLSEKQVLEGNTILSKYILLANMPEDIHGKVEPFKNRTNWVKYYATPLLPSGLWGLKPNYLGNNILSSSKQPVVGKMYY